MSVRDYVKKTLEEKRNNEGEPVKFTVALNPYNIRRLDHISEQLNLPRSTLARDLIVQALNDVCKELGLEEVDDVATERLRESLDPDDPDANYGVEVLTEYGDWVRNG